MERMTTELEARITRNTPPGDLEASVAVAVAGDDDVRIEEV